MLYCTIQNGKPQAINTHHENLYTILNNHMLSPVYKDYLL